MIQVDKDTGLFLRYDVEKSSQMNFCTSPANELYTIRYMLQNNLFVDVIWHAENNYYNLEFRPSFPAKIINIVIQKSMYDKVVEHILRTYHLSYFNMPLEETHKNMTF